MLELLISINIYSLVSSNGYLLVSHLLTLNYADRLDLGFHVIKSTNLFDVILGLASMSAHKLEDIKEVIHLEVFMEREFHLLNPIFPHERISNFFFIVFEKVSIRII